MHSGKFNWQWWLHLAVVKACSIPTLSTFTRAVLGRKIILIKTKIEKDMFNIVHLQSQIVFLQVVFPSNNPYLYEELIRQFIFCFLRAFASLTVFPPTLGGIFFTTSNTKPSILKQYLLLGRNFVIFVIRVTQ